MTYLTLNHTKMNQSSISNQLTYVSIINYFPNIFISPIINVILEYKSIKRSSLFMKEPLGVKPFDSLLKLKFPKFLHNKRFRYKGDNIIPKHKRNSLQQKKAISSIQEFGDCIIKK